jgi:hypothetical protein
MRIAGRVGTEARSALGLIDEARQLVKRERVSGSAFDVSFWYLRPHPRRSRDAVCRASLASAGFLVAREGDRGIEPGRGIAEVALADVL